MGGTYSKKLSAAAKEILTWCETGGIWIYASYISSGDKANADCESGRLEPETEYELGRDAFRRISNELGPPSVDIFASRVNTKCPKYVSWKKAPGSVAVNAFTISWNNSLFYAFLPFSIISRVLSKIAREKSRGIVVFPRWPSQPWYPLYMELLASKLVILKPSANILLSFNREPHPLHRQLTLMASILCGKRFE